MATRRHSISSVSMVSSVTKSRTSEPIASGVHSDNADSGPAIGRSVSERSTSTSHHSERSHLPTPPGVAHASSAARSAVAAVGMVASLPTLRAKKRRSSIPTLAPAAVPSKSDQSCPMTKDRHLVHGEAPHAPNCPSYAGMSIGAHHVDLSRAIMHDARKLHAERASTLARQSGEGERNVSLIFAEARTDIMSTVRKYCNVVRALAAFTEVSEKRDRLRRLVKKRLPVLLLKSKVVGELQEIYHRSQDHAGPFSMWERLLADLPTGSMSVGVSNNMSLSAYRSQSESPNKDGRASRSLPRTSPRLSAIKSGKKLRHAARSQVPTRDQRPGHKNEARHRIGAHVLQNTPELV